MGLVLASSLQPAVSRLVTLMLQDLSRVEDEFSHLQITASVGHDIAPTKGSLIFGNSMFVASSRAITFPNGQAFDLNHAQISGRYIHPDCIITQGLFSDVLYLTALLFSRLTDHPHITVLSLIVGVEHNQHPAEPFSDLSGERLPLSEFKNPIASPIARPIRRSFSEEGFHGRPPVYLA